jgi:hypothetical protein
MRRRNGRLKIERVRNQVLAEMLWHMAQLPPKPKRKWKKLLYFAATILVAGIGIGRLIEQSF